MSCPLGPAPRSTVLECTSYRALAAKPLPMNADLEKLVRLHHAEADLKRVEAALAEIPRKRRDALEALARERARLDEARSALDGSQKARKQHEAQVQDLEAKRSKYKGQLMEVKTNKEYTAVLHEIEGVEREIKGREDRDPRGDGEGRGSAGSGQARGDRLQGRRERSEEGRRRARCRGGPARERSGPAAGRARRRGRVGSRRTRASCTRGLLASAAAASRRRATACARPAT